MRVALMLGLVALLTVAAEDDPRRAEQYGLDLLGLPVATEQATGVDMLIAVVDTGVDQNHPDLVAHLVPGADFVDGDDQADDPNGHGTHVAGIAAAVSGNGRGISGAAPDARILPVRVLREDGTGNESTIATGIDWAVDEGADVVNLSLGGEGLAARVFKNGVLNRAIRNAAARGVVVVVAAGNEPTFQRSYRPAVPVIVVNAVDAQGDPAAFTTFGDPRAVAAPGVGVLSTAPVGPSTIWPAGTDGYERLDGTSQAAPFVSAVAALLVSEGLNVDQVRATLVQTAENPENDPRLGAGLVDAPAALQRALDSRGATHPAVPAPADPAIPPVIVPALVVAVAVGVPAAAFRLVRRRT